MPELKILCCADLHLGRASAWIEGPASVDRSALGAWDRIVEHAIRGRADAVVIAGDIFDSMGSYFSTRGRFRSGLERLLQADIPAIAVAGNHDWDSLPRFVKAHPESGLVLLGAGGSWQEHSIPGVHFVGWSFSSPTCKTRAFDTFPVIRSPDKVIGILHGDADAAGSVHNPVSRVDLNGTAHAWILGHIHLPGTVGDRAAYPGSPQALDFGPGERKHHGFMWLTFSDGKPRYEAVPISTVYYGFEERRVPVPEGADALTELENDVHACCESIRSASTYVRSVQLRVDAELVGASQDVLPPKLSNDYDCWEFLSIRRKAARDLWSDVREGGARAVFAKLLIAAKSKDGFFEERAVPSGWVADCDLLIGRVADDSRNHWSRIASVARDPASEAAFVPLSDSDMSVAARKAMIAHLESQT